MDILLKIKIGNFRLQKTIDIKFVEATIEIIY
jgi:hypothetical protein